MGTAHQRLLERALDLPIASASDFADKTKIPTNVQPQLLRTIQDTSLRARLLIAGVAEGLQSPRGTQRIASIIRIYPNADAPPPERTAATRGPRGKTSNNRATHNAANAHAVPRRLPTVEELNELLNRLMHEEQILRRSFQKQIDTEIQRLKRALATTEDDDFERCFRQLQCAVESRTKLDASVREEAFRVVDADADFAPRAFLSLITPEKKLVNVA